MCKRKVGRVSREVTDACLQFWGGQGYMWDNLVTRAYRDTRLVSIGGGADEVMLGIICKMMGILPSKKKFEQAKAAQAARSARSEEHTSELQSLMRTSYAVFCLKKKTS